MCNRTSLGHTTLWHSKTETMISHDTKNKICMLFMVNALLMRQVPAKNFSDMQIHHWGGEHVIHYPFRHRRIQKPSLCCGGSPTKRQGLLLANTIEISGNTRGLATLNTLRIKSLSTHLRWRSRTNCRPRATALFLLWACWGQHREPAATQPFDPCLVGSESLLAQARPAHDPFPVKFKYHSTPVSNQEEKLL